MQQSKKRLHVIQDDKQTKTVVGGTTCFATHAQFAVNCKREKCKHWISHPETQNCVLIAAQKGPYTLQKVGQIYGLTRMRICQIEKNIFEKIRRITA